MLAEKPERGNGELDQFRCLGNYPPTPPLTQYFAPSEMQNNVNIELGEGRWAVSKKPNLIW